MRSFGSYFDLISKKRLRKPVLLKVIQPHDVKITNWLLCLYDYFVSSQKEWGSGVTPHPDLLKEYLIF
jgi:hypothetical protein